MSLLITIEGGEYMGKSTVATPGLCDVLTHAGVTVSTSREPGGTPHAEQLRKNIFERKRAGASAEEMTTLFYQARQMLLHDVILPTLGKKKEKDAVLILDRYVDSTRVYQGCEEGIPLNKLQEYDRTFIQSYLPNYTFILYVPEKQFKETIQTRQNINDRNNSSRAHTVWDEDSIAKHLQRQRFYLTIPQMSKQLGEDRQFFFINASQQPTEIIRQMTTQIAGPLLHDTTISTSCRTEQDFQDIVDHLSTHPKWASLRNSGKGKAAN